MNVAVLGYGVVGSGVVDLLIKNEVSIAKKANEQIKIKYVLDIRDFSDSPYANLFTKDFEQIINDDEIDVVIEVIGGLNPAYSFVKRSLMAGKSVVTSNKELVATYGDELLQIAKDSNLNFLFEASVGGGIPIIRPINQCLAANEIKSVSGILNGTTNFILTKMINNSYSFEQALRKAGELGYAEADPSSDIDGIDSCRKIAILASLAFGKHVDPNKIHTEGIRNIKLEDVEFCDKLGYSIKLIGKANLLDDNKLYAIVAPFLVRKSNPLAGIDDVFNGIMVEGDAIGVTMFYGRGAGKLPTASAVVADIIDCAKHRESRKYLFWSKPDEDYISDFKEYKYSYYLRISCEDKSKAITNAKSIFGELKVCDDVDEPVFITDVHNENAFEKLLGEYLNLTDAQITTKMRVFKL